MPSTVEASSRPDHEDPELRGRRYAIPYHRVWMEALGLVNNRGPKWTTVEADDQGGRLRADVAAAPFGPVGDVEIRIGLDSDAQTRVNMTSRSRSARWDLGANARRIRSFFRDLDSRLSAQPNVILSPGDDPTEPLPPRRSTAPSGGS